jgi:hypothetical protein
MAWVRIHDGAMGNLKVMRLSASAFRLWVRGLCYCQQHLTDGLIPREALKFLDAKRADVDMLCEPTVEGKSALWEKIEGFGFKVHDYLDWNDSREVIEEKRDRARSRAHVSRTSRARHSERAPHVASGVVKSSDLTSIQISERESEGKPPTLIRPDPFTDATITERAGRFLERYEALYAQHRRARYLVSPQRDYNAAVRLCETWTDDTRLDKLAAIFLTTDHDFAVKGSRTIPQFAALASWADSQLAEWEKRKGVA